ncbi:MAG TPA: WD40 repeat domain-containing protein, partial [Candidatus Acidoferrales bacterium]
MRTARKTLLMVVVGIVVVASSARVHSSQSTSTTEPYPYQIGHTRDLLFVAWSQDSTRLISYSWADAAVLVWNVKDGRLITSFNKDFVGHPGDITWGAGMSLTTLNNNAMEVRDNLTNALLWRIVRQGPSTSTSPDGALIAEGGRYGDACITIRDARSGAFIRRLEGHPGIVRGLAFSPDGRFVASANGDRTVVIRDSHSGKVVTVLPGNEKPIDSVAFNRDGQKIAVGGDDGTLRIWRTETSSIIWSSKVDRAPVNSVTFSRDGETLASGGGDRVIRIWNATDGHLLSECTTVGEYSDEHTTECCGSSVNALAFSPSGMDIAAGLGDGSIEIWNVSTGKLAFNKQSDKE